MPVYGPAASATARQETTPATQKAMRTDILTRPRDRLSTAIVTATGMQMAHTRKASTTLAEDAYNGIRDRILRGVFPIGSSLSRRKLAEMLGMSQLPVSEALQRLESDGLVETKARAGTRVRNPTPEDIRDSY